MQTRKSICRDYKISNSTLIKTIEYLKIESIKKYDEKAHKICEFYEDNDVDKIVDFIKNNDTTKIFSQLTKIKNYGSIENYKKNQIEKTKKTKLERYGDENYCNAKLISEKNKKLWTENKDNLVSKVKNTKLKKYDDENYCNKEKIKNTKLEKYGNPTYNNNIKCSETWKNKTQEEIDELTLKTKKTKLERYGDENYNNVKRYKTTFNNNTNIIKENYNVFTVKDVANSLMMKRQKISDICIKLNLGFIKNNKLYLTSNEIEIIKNHINNHKGDGYSYSEKEVLSFIQSIYNNEIIENSKSIIPPKELDIYIPSKKLAIEFDGLFWHNELHLDNNYHLDKTNSCNSKGIDLIHIFEDDWLNHKEIVKSMIASRLGIYERKIFARKCEIKTVDKKLCKKFFDENHLQGFAKGDIYLGLFYNDELVQSIIINKKGWHDGNVELTRMVSKINTQVIGGFSKLMKHLVNDYNFNSVTSYVYKAWFNGKGYEESGFKVMNENKPSYSYIVNDSRIHKSKFRKEKIKKLYEEGILKYWNEKESEHENMLKNGIFRIYDCGTIKVEYNL